MKYHLYCEITEENYIRLLLEWYEPDISHYPWFFYIASYLEPEYFTQAIMSLQGNITWLMKKEEKVSAKEMDYLYTLRNIQYRIWRFTREARSILNA